MGQENSASTVCIEEQPKQPEQSAAEKLRALEQFFKQQKPLFYENHEEISLLQTTSKPRKIKDYIFIEANPFSAEAYAKNKGLVYASPFDLLRLLIENQKRPIMANSFNTGWDVIYLTGRSPIIGPRFFTNLSSELDGQDEFIKTGRMYFSQNEENQLLAVLEKEQGFHLENRAYLQLSQKETFLISRGRTFFVLSHCARDPQLAASFLNRAQEVQKSLYFYLETPESIEELSGPPGPFATPLRIGGYNAGPYLSGLVPRPYFKTTSQEEGKRIEESECIVLPIKRNLEAITGNFLFKTQKEKSKTRCATTA